jgi:hypothetical protein
MQPYGNKKIIANLVDNHPRPKKIWANWWEVNFNMAGKKKARQQGKKEINTQFREYQLGGQTG